VTSTPALVAVTAQSRSVVAIEYCGRSGRGIEGIVRITVQSGAGRQRGTSPWTSGAIEGAAHPSPKKPLGGPVSNEGHRNAVGIVMHGTAAPSALDMGRRRRWIMKSRWERVARGSPTTGQGGHSGRYETVDLRAAGGGQALEGHRENNRHNGGSSQRSVTPATRGGTRLARRRSCKARYQRLGTGGHGDAQRKILGRVFFGDAAIGGGVGSDRLPGRPGGGVAVSGLSSTCCRADSGRSRNGAVIASKGRSTGTGYDGHPHLLRGTLEGFGSLPVGWTI